MKVEDYLFLKGERYFEADILNLYHLKRSGKIISERYDKVIFKNIPSCDEFLACSGELFEEGYKIALILKEHPSEIEKEKINKTIYKTIPAMYSVNIFVLSDDEFQESISNAICLPKNY